ncbi:unnamed protein product [Calypogeia fissa]
MTVDIDSQAGAVQIQQLVDDSMSADVKHGVPRIGDWCPFIVMASWLPACSHLRLRPVLSTAQRAWTPMKP